MYITSNWNPTITESHPYNVEQNNHIIWLKQWFFLLFQRLFHHLPHFSKNYSNLHPFPTKILFQNLKETNCFANIFSKQSTKFQIRVFNWNECHKRPQSRTHPPTYFPTISSESQPSPNHNHHTYGDSKHLTYTIYLKI